MSNVPQVLAGAHEALAASDWETARRLFADALVDGETPEALEGLARANFFLNEGEVALAARERAYAAYRASGLPVDAARVAIALAWDYRSVRGERAVSDGWLARARRLLEGQGRTAEQGWLALREGSFALPGDPVLARTRCAEAEALGRALGDIDLEMTALALGGLARVSQGEIADGMARLDEATTAATAGEMRDPVAIGFSCCYLIRVLVLLPDLCVLARARLRARRSVVRARRAHDRGVEHPRAAGRVPAQLLARRVLARAGRRRDRDVPP
jgi:hypothetical protein